MRSHVRIPLFLYLTKGGGDRTRRDDGAGMIGRKLSVNPNVIPDTDRGSM